jgi:hypothetical protein
VAVNACENTFVASPGSSQVMEILERTDGAAVNVVMYEFGGGTASRSTMYSSVSGAGVTRFAPLRDVANWDDAAMNGGYNRVNFPSRVPWKEAVHSTRCRKISNLLIPAQFQAGCVR